jgi:uncharacterized protein YpmB
MKIEKATVIVLIVLIALFSAVAYSVRWSWKTHEELKSSKEQSIPSRSIYMENSNIHTTIDIVEIDGVEYIIASTNRGVSICKK